MRRRRTRWAAVLAVAALLLPALPDAVAAQPYVPSGTPISGGDDSGSAVSLPPGQYLDTLARGSDVASDDGSARFYAITLRRGETPYVAATLAAPEAVTDDVRLAVSVTLTAPGEASPCGSDDASDDGFDDRLSAVTAVAAPGVTGGDDACPAGKILVRIARSGDLALDDPLDVEIAYRLEPAADTAGLPTRPATATDAVRPDLTGQPATLESGDGFATAPVVGTGIYRDTLTADDIRIVRVRLGWGQRLAYSFTASGLPDLEFDDGIDVVADVYNPVRQLVADADGGTGSATVGGQDAAMNGATPAPVRYANRDSDDPDVVTCSLAGDWFLVLQTDHPSAGAADTAVPYTLQVQVFGTAGRAPDYRLPAGATPPPTADASGGSSSTGVVVGVAAAVVVLLAAGLLLVLRRRRTAQRRVHT